MKSANLKLCVFLTDSMDVFNRKGEIKPRYYNPGSLFSEVHMFSFSSSDIKPAMVQDCAGKAKLYIYPLGRPNLFNMPWIYKRANGLLEKIKPDLIRAYDISLRGALACYFAKKLQILSVISIHNNFDQQREFDKRPILQIRKILERYSISNCDMLICVSEFLKRYAVKYKPRDIRVIFNRVDLQNFSPLKLEPRKNQLPRLLSVARLVSQKSQECLIRAIKDLEVRLILIGSGPKFGSLKKIAQDLGIMHKLEFIPAVQHSQIQAYYRQADIFVHSSHYEGFCIPIIEAMATGLPIVASDLEVISELTDGCAILCSNKPEYFADAIKQLIGDPLLCEELGEKARRRAAMFSSIDLEEKEKACYQELLKKQRK